MTLVCRNGIYYAELKVPEDVRSSIGKTNLRRSLKTRDKNRKNKDLNKLRKTYRKSYKSILSFN